ncbi:MAG TPA: 16S rRNA (guanine(527)-N(7))-methyltransferase RsmG [Pyrinomonadaceae bacterium]|nr:16S rRNA (guanine(527)-N(7))-methyltransferase RsmG [Pyrinomonadaceae bacterium]
MTALPKQIADFEAALMTNAPAYDIEISTETLQQLTAYYQLLHLWNPRLHLVAPCSPDEFAQRHILESLLLLPYLSQAARIVDIGSGAGLPIIPCLISRPDLSATLFEAAKRKAVFLREALSLVGRSNAARVLTERFENAATPDCESITSRALDRFTQILPRLIEWAPQQCTLLLFGGDELRKALETPGLDYSQIHVPNSEQRFLFIVERPK